MEATNEKGMKFKILMIGPLPPPIGGIAVSFKTLVDLLQYRGDLEIRVVDFNAIRRRKGRLLRGLLSLCKEVISKTRQVDIITVYFSSTALTSLGLLLLMLSRVLGKPLIVRKAAGFDYLDLGFFRGRIAHFVVKHADMYLAETKNLVRLALDRGISHVKWYPTSRLMDEGKHIQSFEGMSCRRFVFVGQVREYKGVGEIIRAAERFDEGISVDIYGPLFDDLEKYIFEGCKRVKYCGILSSDDVIPTLKRYDMLLLPTKALTEGYPGAVFEGYSAGLPIITTRCGGLPEIVDEKSGIFVEPGNSESLFEAMKTVVEDNRVYHRLRLGILEKRKDFDGIIWASRFVEYCEDVVAMHGSPKRGEAITCKADNDEKK